MSGLAINGVSDLQWADADHSAVSMTVEFSHLDGPVPFTAKQNDDMAHGQLLFAGAVAGVYGPIADYVPPTITVAQQLAQYERDLDTFLDAKAQELTFKDRHSLALRAGYPNPWQALGAAFGQWMDTCNATAWLGMQEILAGTRPMPESKEAFLAELPPFVPPAP